MQRLRLAHLLVHQRGRRALLGEVPLQDAAGHQALHQRARPRRIVGKHARVLPGRSVTARSSDGDFPQVDDVRAGHAGGRRRQALVQPVRPDQGVAARRLSARSRSACWSSTATRTTTSPRSSRPRSRRRTSCRASASRPTRCCRRASSPMPTRTATGSARTTRCCRSTRRVCPVHHYHKDGPMRFFPQRHAATADAYYEPNSFGGAGEDKRFAEPPLKISGDADRYNHRDGNDDYRQPGDLFRLMTPDAQARLMDNIAAAMQGVPAEIVERQIGHFYQGRSGLRARRRAAHRPQHRQPCSRGGGVGGRPQRRGAVLRRPRSPRRAMRMHRHVADLWCAMGGECGQIPLTMARSTMHRRSRCARQRAAWSVVRHRGAARCAQRRLAAPASMRPASSRFSSCPVSRSPIQCLPASRCSTASRDHATQTKSRAASPRGSCLSAMCQRPQARLAEAPDVSERSARVAVIRSALPSHVRAPRKKVRERPVLCHTFA